MFENYNWPVTIKAKYTEKVMIIEIPNSDFNNFQQDSDTLVRVGDR